MATLDTLIKLSEKKLEDCQKKIAKLDEEKQSLDRYEREMEMQMDEGYKQANKEDIPIAYKVVGKFGNRVEVEKKRMNEARKYIAMARQGLMVNMKELFIEKKRYEVLRDERARKAKIAHAKKEQAILEDLANR